MQGTKERKGVEIEVELSQLYFLARTKQSLKPAIANSSKKKKQNTNDEELKEHLKPPQSAIYSELPHKQPTKQNEKNTKKNQPNNLVHL